VSHRRWAFSILIAVAAVSIHGPAAVAAPAVVVEHVNGTADIEKQGDAVVGVTTSSDTTVIVKIDAVHDVTVYQNTQLDFGEVLRLGTGTVRVRGVLTVATANATAITSNSEITVAYDDRFGITTVEVADRDAVVRGNSDGADQRVPAGQMVRVGTDGIGTVPEVISPDEVGASRVAPTNDDASPARNNALPYFVAGIAAVCLIAGVVGSRRTRNAAASA
jgi:hypothetical protein